MWATAFGRFEPLNPNSAQETLFGLGFNRSTQQIGQNVLPVFDSLVFF